MISVTIMKPYILNIITNDNKISDNNVWYSPSCPAWHSSLGHEPRSQLERSEASLEIQMILWSRGEVAHHYTHWISAQNNHNMDVTNESGYKKSTVGPQMSPRVRRGPGAVSTVTTAELKRATDAMWRIWSEGRKMRERDQNVIQANGWSNNSMTVRANTRGLPRVNSTRGFFSQFVATVPRPGSVTPNGQTRMMMMILMMVMTDRRHF